MTEPEQAELVAALSPEHVELYKAGQITLSAGADPAKPVIRWAKGTPQGGRAVKGTGLPPALMTKLKTGEVQRSGAVKRTSAYRDLMEYLVDDDRFAWIFDQLWKAIDGEPSVIEFTCPECGAEHQVEGPNKIDTRAALQIINQLAGKPTEHKVVDVDIRARYEALDERFDPSSIRVNTIDPDEAMRRAEALADSEESEQDVIEIEAVDVD